MGYTGQSTKTTANKVVTYAYSAEICKQKSKTQLNQAIHDNIEGLAAKAKELNLQARVKASSSSSTKQFELMVYTSVPIDSFEGNSKAKSGIKQIEQDFKKSMKELGIKEPVMPFRR